MLRYYLAALRLEEALAARPRARKLQGSGGLFGPVPRVDMPTPGQEYFKLPLDGSGTDGAVAEVVLEGKDVGKAFDAELCAFFEDCLYRRYRSGDEDEDGGHLLCFPVVHLPRGELAGLLRMKLVLQFQSGGRPFELPTRARRRRGPWPAPPDRVRAQGEPRDPEDWPFFIDTRLLHRHLGVSGEAIDRLFDALRACEALTPRSMLTVLLRALEQELAGLATDDDAAPSKGEGGSVSDAGADAEAVSSLSAVGLMARLTKVVAALVARQGEGGRADRRARAFPVAIVISGQQAKTTWHLQQEILQLLRRKQPKPRDDSPLASYLTGRKLAPGRGLQRALGHGPPLTASQRTAAEWVWGSRLTAVQGPPGTGKTTLIQHLCAEFLVQQVECLVSGGDMGPGPLLVASSNNRAVDNAIGLMEAGAPGSVAAAPAHVDSMAPGPGSDDADGLPADLASLGELPIALRVGSRQVCERVAAGQLRQAALWLERAQGLSRAACEATFERAKRNFIAARDRVGAALSGRARAFAREQERAEVLRALSALDGVSGQEPQAHATSVPLPALDAPAGEVIARFAKLEARLIELSDLCELSPGLGPLQRVAQHFARTERKHLPVCEGSLRALGLPPRLNLPPDLPASTDPAVLMASWQEASEDALQHLAGAAERLREAKREARQVAERTRLLARLKAIGEVMEAPAVELPVAHQRALYDAALSLRAAWAAARADTLLPSVRAAAHCVVDQRSLKPFIRDDPDGFARLGRLFGVWGCTLLSLGNAVPAEAGALPRVIIDEAGQCHPAHAISALLRAQHALVIGDVHQLAPVIELTRDDERRLLSQLEPPVDEGSLAPYRVHAESEVSVQALADRAVHRRFALTDHFRCQPEIIALSDRLCHYGLSIHTPRRARTDRAPFLTHPVGWVDVAGQQERLGGSWYNRVELEVVERMVARLLEGGIEAQEIAVITPYRGQLERLRRAFVQRGIPLEASIELSDDDDATRLSRHGLALGTVHRFQGGERSVVLFSSVVSRRSSLPFLNQRQNLLNVAISRAQHHLVAIGNRALLAEGAVTGVLAGAGAPVRLEAG